MQTQARYTYCRICKCDKSIAEHFEELLNRQTSEEREIQLGLTIRMMHVKITKKKYTIKKLMKKCSVRRPKWRLKKGSQRSYANL